MTDKKLSDRFRGLLRAVRRHWAVAAGVVLVAGIAAVVVFQLRSTDGEADAASAPDATDAPVSNDNAARPSTAESDSAEKTPAAETDSDTAVRDFFETRDIALQSDEDIADPDAVDLDAVAQGFVKGELEAIRAEFAANGWYQKGSVKVAEIQTVDSNQDAEPPTVTLQVCLDSSEVAIVDEDGDPVFSPDDGTPDRVPHLYTLVHTDSGWKVTEHSFPQARSC